MVHTTTIPATADLVNKIEQVLTRHEHLLHNASYETGLPGLSLFYYYYAKFTGESRYYNLAEEYLEKGIACLDAGKFNRIYATDSFDNHMAHVGRYLEFAGKNNIIGWDTEDFLA